MSGYFSPGRIEVFGKHTDYAGGHVLLCAVDRGVTALVKPGSTGIRARSSAAADAVLLTPGVDAGLPAGHWGRYLQVVVDRLEANFGPLRPADLEIDTDLPLASGMSSSSALVVACALALVEFNGIDRTAAWTDNIATPLDVATYLASTEMGGDFRGLAGNAGVGTKGGSEDHTAMLCSGAGQLGLFHFDPPTDMGRVEFPDDLEFVVAVSGVMAEKTGPALALYNRASAGVREVVRRWNRATGRSEANLAAVVDAVAGDPDRLFDLVRDDPYLTGRLRQFVIESTELVPGAFAALQTGDLAAFGQIAARSFAEAAQGLENQIPQTHALVDSALALGGLAASAFGAGFGGSVWALVPKTDADAFAGDWLASYLRSFPELGNAATTLVTPPSGPAHAV